MADPISWLADLLDRVLGPAAPNEPLTDPLDDPRAWRRASDPHPEEC